MLMHLLWRTATPTIRVRSRCETLLPLIESFEMAAQHVLASQCVFPVTWLLTFPTIWRINACLETNWYNYCIPQLRDHV